MFTSPPFIWALIGLLLIGSEFLVPGFVIFFFGERSVLSALPGNRHGNCTGRPFGTERIET